MAPRIHRSAEPGGDVGAAIPTTGKAATRFTSRNAARASGAAPRLLESLAGLRGATVMRPDGGAAVRLTDLVAVVEGAARSATAPDTVEVLSAAQNGDREIVAQAGRVIADGAVPLFVTADRGQHGRLTNGAEVAGPEWLNWLLGR